MKIPSLLRSIPVSVSLLLTQGCLSDSADSTAPDASGTGAAVVRISPVPLPSTAAARALSAEAGGRLVVQVRLDNRSEKWTDSVDWTGGAADSLSFSALPQATSYLVRAEYRDAQGRTTHADSVYPVSILPGKATGVALTLRALLGRIVVSMPSVPSTVDSLGIRWTGPFGTRSAVVARGTSGKTVLRLDSLPVGTSGAARLRAWNALGDTLYGCDTSISIASQADQSLSLTWSDATGRAALSVGVAPGGETDVTALFPSDSVADGSLRIAGISDSGAADWVLVENAGTSAVSGRVTVAHGTESVSATVSLAPGAAAVLSKVSCADTARTTHPLHGVPNLVCGLPLSVAWAGTGVLWQVYGPSGRLAERALVWDGKYGWPDLNSSTARTLRRRTGAAGSDAMAGRSWCSEGSDAPSDTCS